MGLFNLPERYNPITQLGAVGVLAKQKWFPSQNLIPGDVTKMLTGIPAGQMYAPSSQGGQTQGALDYNANLQPQTAPQTAPQPTGGGSIPTADPYQSVYDQLDRLASWLPEQKSTLEGQINTLSGLQAQNVNQNLEHAMSYVPYWKGNVATNQKNTLSALAQDTQNLMQAGNTYLGSKGAGDSSATGRYSYALTKEANKRRADVLNQSNSLYSAIDMKAGDIQNTASSQINQINQWKATKLADLTSSFQDRLNELAMTRVNLTTQEANYWLEQLGSLESSANGWSQAVSQWGTDKLGELDQMKITLNQTAQFTPEQLKYDVMPSVAAAGNQNTGDQYVPWFNPAKDETKSLFQT